MAGGQPVRISVAEMKSYYIYSEWCSWLCSTAEGESRGHLRVPRGPRAGCAG